MVEMKFLPLIQTWKNQIHWWLLDAVLFRSSDKYLSAIWIIAARSIVRNFCYTQFESSNIHLLIQTLNTDNEKLPQWFLYHQWHLIDSFFLVIYQFQRDAKPLWLIYVIKTSELWFFLPYLLLPISVPGRLETNWIIQCVLKLFDSFLFGIHLTKYLMFSLNLTELNVLFVYTLVT